MKNIAVIVTSLKSGGAERIAGLLSKRLASVYNVYLFLLDTEEIIYEYGGTIVDIGKSGPFYEFAIKTYKEKYKIECAISFLEIMNFANIRTKGREKVIISERSVQSLIDPELYGETYRIKRNYNAADGVVACSFGVKEDLINNYHVHVPVEVIYNFVNKERIRQDAQRGLPEDIKAFLDGAEYFVNVGRLHPQKNQERLIRQFALFRKTSGRNYKLLVLGDGELKVRLNQLIAELGLVGSVKVIAYTNNPFMYLNSARALILASHYEGLPNVIIEAMVLKCPVIATDCLAGPRELLADIHEYDSKMRSIVKYKRGVLVPDALTDDFCETTFLADAMSIVSEDMEYISRVKMEEEIYIEKYTNEAIVRQWVDMIENCDDRNEHILDQEKEILDNASVLAIYGAGYIGKSLFFRLKKEYEISAFIVTEKKQDEDYLFGIPVKEINDYCNVTKKPTIIIGLGDFHQNEVMHNLEIMGFDQIVYPFIIPYTYDYYKNYKDWDLSSEISEWYSISTNQIFNEGHPVTYNEKIQWLKIHRNNPIKSRLADKIKVREYVKDKIGDKYLIPLIGIWDKFEDIHFSDLPNKFALKCNHASGTNIIVWDKNRLDFCHTEFLINKWLNLDYGKDQGLELHYSSIKPRILAEKLLETEDGSDLKDYKVFVFNGKVKLIQVDIDRHHNHARNLYTPQWDYLPYGILYPTAPETIIVRPECLDEMICLAETLGKGFVHVRVDFYICNNRIYFGEMTFTHGSGIEKFTPDSFGYEMGSWMNLSEGE